MEQRKAIIRTYISKGMKADAAAKMAGMSKSTYYYKPRPGKPGRKASTHCHTADNRQVPNDFVVEDIRSMLGIEFLENGYHKVTRELQDMGYRIGKKKTYRLMKENRLLLPRQKKGTRDFVRFTQPLPFEPFEKLEMDIKFIYIRGSRKNALLLTILDTFTRIAMGWELQFSMQHTAVEKLFKQVIDTWLTDYRPPFDEDMTVTIRCDNDGRFLAHNLKSFLQQNFIQQEFILPATPQQNAHIESFHSVVEKLVCQKYVFEDIEQARKVFNQFFYTYNNRRTISTLLYLPPVVFLQQWMAGNIGINFRRVKGKIKQQFFFTGQRPKWISVLPEDFLIQNACKIDAKSNIFVEPLLI